MRSLMKLGGRSFGAGVACVMAAQDPYSTPLQGSIGAAMPGARPRNGRLRAERGPNRGRRKVAGAGCPCQRRRVTEPHMPRVARLRGWIGEHAYLILAAGAVLVLTRTVEFSPPPVVREDKAAHGGVVG